MEILLLILLIAAANALPVSDGKSRLKFYLNNLKTNFHEDEKIWKSELLFGKLKFDIFLIISFY